MQATNALSAHSTWPLWQRNPRSEPTAQSRIMRLASIKSSVPFSRRSATWTPGTRGLADTVALPTDGSDDTAQLRDLRKRSVVVITPIPESERLPLGQLNASSAKPKGLRLYLLEILSSRPATMYSLPCVLPHMSSTCITMMT